MTDTAADKAKELSRVLRQLDKAKGKVAELEAKKAALLKALGG